MAEALVLIPEVDIKWAVVDKNTSEALRSWLSCRGLTTTVAESLSTLVGPTHIPDYDKLVSVNAVIQRFQCHNVGDGG